MLALYITSIVFGGILPVSKFDKSVITEFNYSIMFFSLIKIERHDDGTNKVENF